MADRLHDLDTLAQDLSALTEHGPRMTLLPTEWPAWLAIASAACGGLAGCAGGPTVAAALVGLAVGLHVAHGRAVDRYLTAFRRENDANQRRVDALTEAPRG